MGLSAVLIGCRRNVYGCESCADNAMFKLSLWNKPHLLRGIALLVHVSCNDRDVRGKSSNTSGVPGRGTEERVNAAPVVVGTGTRPGCTTIHLGITRDGHATESTQLAGRGGCTRHK